MTTAAMTKAHESAAPAGLPDMKVSVRQVFGIDSDLEVPAYSEVDPHVPDIDSDYRYDRATTLAILAGFAKEPPRRGDRLYSGRQVDPYRAGRSAAEGSLAVRARQPRQPHQPDRSWSARIPSSCATTCQDH